MNRYNNQAFNTGRFDAGKPFQNHRLVQPGSGTGTGHVSQYFGQNTPAFININQFHHPGNYQVALSFEGIQGARRETHGFQQQDAQGINPGALVPGNRNPQQTSYPFGYNPAPINRDTVSSFQHEFEGDGYRLGSGSTKEVVSESLSRN